MGGLGYFIKGEFILNGFNNILKYLKGVLLMVRVMYLDLVGS